MKRLTRCGFILLLGIVAVRSQAGEKSSADGGNLLAFALQKEPLVYAVHSKTETKTYASRGSSGLMTPPYSESANQALMTKTTADVRYKFRLTRMERTKDGLLSMRYEPFDHEADMDSTGAAGHFVTTIHGLDVKSMQNGITIIDTEKEIGTSQAKAYKNDVVPVLLSGGMYMDGGGKIKDLSGDLPFVDFWLDELKTHIGLFSLQLPAHAMTNDESWEVITPMKTSGPIKLSEQLIRTNRFTLVGDDLTTDPSLVTIKLSAPMLCHNLTGSIEGRGQSTQADLSEFEIHNYGTLHFDKKRGIFVDEELNGSVSVTMTALLQGRAVSTHMETRTTTEIELLPTSANNPGGNMEKVPPKNL